MFRVSVAIAVLLAACVEREQPDTLARYYIENRLDTPVHVSVATHQGQVSLRTDSVPMNGTELIFEVIEGGGVLLPSAFMHAFIVSTVDSLGGMDTIYKAVNDTDWNREPITSTRATVVFVVD